MLAIESLVRSLNDVCNMERYLLQAIKCIFKIDFNPLYQNFAMASSIRVSFIIFAVVYEWLSVLLPDKSRNMSSHCHLTLQFDLTLQDTHLHSLKRLFRALFLETEVWKRNTIDSKFDQLAGIFEWIFFEKTLLSLVWT